MRRQAFVVPRNQVGQFLGNLLSNGLVLGGFFRGQTSVAGNALHGRLLHPARCLLQSSQKLLNQWFGQLVAQMKRLSRAVVVFLALAVGGALALFRYDSASPLCYAEVEGYEWDKKTQRCVSVIIRIDDQQVLAQVQPWRDALRQTACDQALRRLVGSLLNRRHCENALRPPMERLTLVYEDGHREIEQVNVYRTPFGDCWQEARRMGAGVAP